MQFLLSVLKPVSRDRDKARREFVLNYLLVGSLFISGLVSLLALVADITAPVKRGGVHFFVFVSVYLFFLVCLHFSKRGQARLISYIFIFGYYLLITQLAWVSGASVPQALLMFALIVVMSGILVNSAFGFLMTTVIVATLLLLNYLERHSLLPIVHPWKHQPLYLADSVVHGITLLIIAGVSWLFNRESEKAFQRAKASEAALQKERDSLAIKVAKKTKELRKEQADKVAQIYKFAEFGKLASGVVHDLSNSVMLVSANLDQVDQQEIPVQSLKEGIARARVGARQLENFIVATRRRLNNRETLTKFSLNEEMTHVLEIMSHKAKSHGVSLSLIGEAEIKMYGSASKFHQLMSNLISNAIDAYDGLRRKEKVVTITLTKTKQQIEVRVIDTARGISKKDLPQVFEPFFSTKKADHATGLGLAISHDIVTKAFGGSITVVSELKKGTQFAVRFPLHHKI